MFIDALIFSVHDVPTSEQLMLPVCFSLKTSTDFQPKAGTENLLGSLNATQ